MSQKGSCKVPTSVSGQQIFPFGVITCNQRGLTTFSVDKEHENSQKLPSTNNEKFSPCKENELKIMLMQRIIVHVSSLQIISDKSKEHRNPPGTTMKLAE